MCKPGASLAPGPACDRPQVPVPCGVPYQLGTLVIVMSPVLPGLASHMNLKPTSLQCLCCCQLDSGPDLLPCLIWDCRWTLPLSPPQPWSDPAGQHPIGEDKLNLSSKGSRANILVQRKHKPCGSCAENEPSPLLGSSRLLWFSWGWGSVQLGTAWTKPDDTSATPLFLDYPLRKKDYGSVCSS